MNLIEEYRNFSIETRGLAEKSVSEYVRVLKDISTKIDLLGVTSPSEIDDALIELEKKKGWKRRYTYKYSRVLKTFYGWLFYRQLTQTNLYPYSKIRKPAPGEPKFLSQQEFDFVLEVCESAPIVNFQDKVILKFLWDTGLRRSEAASVDISEIDLNKRLVFLPKEKAKGGRKSRILKFREGTAHALGKQIRFAQSRKRNYPFLNEDFERMSSHGIYLRVQKVAQLAEQEFTPHAFRHSLASRMLGKGADIAFCAKLLGHETINQCLHYTNLTEEITSSMYDKYA